MLYDTEWSQNTGRCLKWRRHESVRRTPLLFVMYRDLLLRCRQENWNQPVFCMRFISSHPSPYRMTLTLVQCFNSSQLQLQTKSEESRQSQNIAERHRNEGAYLHFSNRQHRSIASRLPQNHHPRENLNSPRACELSR